MALPNAFNPNLPDPNTPVDNGANTTGSTSSSVQNKPSDRPATAVGSSETGKDKFKVMLKKKLADQGLTSNAAVPAATDEEIAEETAASTTSPFDLAAGASAQQGKGKMFSLGTGTPQDLTALSQANSAALQGAIASFEDTSELDEAEIISQGDIQAATSTGSGQVPQIVNTSSPTTDEIASEEDIKNLHLSTRDTVLKAFSGWDNKKKSNNDLAGLATGTFTADASQMQPLVSGVAQIDGSAQQVGADELAKANLARENTIQLIDQLVQSLNQLSQTDRTDTTITLKYPPIFDGVSITITEFKTAQKEFNVTFNNLTNPSARLLIESKQNQDSLRNSLMQKGYMLQMVTIEPKLDISTSSSSTTSDGKRQGQQGSGRGFGQGGSSQGDLGSLTG